MKDDNKNKPNNGNDKQKVQHNFLDLCKLFAFYSKVAHGDFGKSSNSSKGSRWKKHYNKLHPRRLTSNLIAPSVTIYIAFNNADAKRDVRLTMELQY